MIDALSEPNRSRPAVCASAGAFGNLSGIMADSPAQKSSERRTARTTTTGRRLLIAVAVLGLSACASNPRVEKLADGRFSIDCSGGTPSWTRCHALASKACDGGRFDVISQVSNEGSANVGRNDWSTTGSEVTRRMVVECR